MPQTTPCQHGREHARSGADVEREIDRRRDGGQRRPRHEVDVFAADRREDAVMRMDAAADCGDLDPIHPPLMRADDAQQLAQ